MDEAQLKVKVFTNSSQPLSLIDIQEDSFFQIKKQKIKDDYDVLQIYEVSSTVRF